MKKRTTSATRKNHFAREHQFRQEISTKRVVLILAAEVTVVAVVVCTSGNDNTSRIRSSSIASRAKSHSNDGRGGGTFRMQDRMTAKSAVKSTRSRKVIIHWILGHFQYYTKKTNEHHGITEASEHEDQKRHAWSSRNAHATTKLNKERGQESWKGACTCANEVVEWFR